MILLRTSRLDDVTIDPVARTARVGAGVTWGRLHSVTADPTAPGPGMSRGELLTSLDDLAAKTLLAEPIDPLLSVQLRLLGGRPRPPSGSPHGPLTESHALYLFGVPSTPDTAEAVRTRQQDLTGALRPFLSGRKPYTFLTPGETAANAFTPDALNRLRNLKRERDPQEVFRSNFPVLG